MSAEREPAPSIPPGNPPRPRALLWASLALLATFALLATNGHVPGSIVLGGAALLVAATGLLDALGTFDDAGASTTSVAARRLWLPGLATAGSLVALWGALALAVAGVLPAPVATAAVLVTLSALLVLASTSWLLSRLG